MDDILYSRTVQDCERFCDDVRSPITQILHKKETLETKQIITFTIIVMNQWNFLRQEPSTAEVFLNRAIDVILGDFTLANIVQDHNVCEKQSIHFHRSVTDFCGKSLFPSQRRRLGHSSRFHATRGAGGWSLRKYLIASQNRSTFCEKSS